jgi:ABC-type Fe3+ transport system permease subunit
MPFELRGRGRTGTGAGWPLQAGALVTILFLHLPLAFIVLYAFSTDAKTFVFPPPGLTTRWFGIAFEREDIRQALWLSLQVGAVSTAVAMVLALLRARGHLAAADPAHRSAGHHHRHQPAQRHRLARHPLQLLDHRHRACDLLRRSGV